VTRGCSTFAFATVSFQTPTFCLLVLPPVAADFEEAVDARGCTVPGDIALAGTVGGGPGSAAGDLL
jgi:hypothetical protein